MRTSTTTRALVALAAGLLLTACTSTGEAAPAPSASTTTTPTPTTEATAEPTATAATKGTLDAPATAGADTVTLTDAGKPVYEVALGAANFAAWDAITAFYPGNEPAPEGSTYVLLPVTGAYVGSGPLEAQAWLDLKVTFVAADGREFATSTAILPEDLSVTPKLATGDSATGNVSFIVPQDAVTGGTWKVEYLPTETPEPIYFTAV